MWQFQFGQNKIVTLILCLLNTAYPHILLNWLWFYTEKGTSEFHRANSILRTFPPPLIDSLLIFISYCMLRHKSDPRCHLRWIRLMTQTSWPQQFNHLFYFPLWAVYVCPPIMCILGLSFCLENWSFSWILFVARLNSKVQQSFSFSRNS